MINVITTQKKQINKEKKIIENTNLVYYFARRNFKECYSEDLIQEGIYGLVKAADKFDPSKGVKFSTYASYWIKCYMINYKYSRRQIHIPAAKRYTHQHPKICSINDLTNTIAYKENNKKEKLDELYRILNISNLTHEEKNIIDKKYLKNVSYERLCKEYKTSKYRMQLCVKKILNKIRSSIN
tara:strand:+ start:96 stop:644 length:549 start_codon:yes stop_codon:yes gene_type:complete